MAGKLRWTHPRQSGRSQRGGARSVGNRDAAQKQAFATVYTVNGFRGAAALIIAMLTGVLLTRSIAVPNHSHDQRHDKRSPRAIPPSKCRASVAAMRSARWQPAFRFSKTA